MTRKDPASLSPAGPTAPESPRGGRFPSPGDLLALLGIALGAQIVVALATVVAGLLFGADYETLRLDPVKQGRFMAATYLAVWTITLVATLYYRRVRGGGGRVAPFARPRLGLAGFLWAFALLFAVGVVIDPLLSLLPDPPAYAGRGFWAVVTLVLFAPLFEELLCRGIILGVLRGRYGVVRAWRLSSLFFAVLHVQPAPVVNAFVLGLVLGFFCIATGSIWVPVVLHAANNAMAYVLMSAGYADASWSDLIGNRGLYLLFYAAALALAFFSARMVWRRIRLLHDGEKNREEA